MPEPGPDGVRHRRPTEADYVPIVRLIDDWWGSGPGSESLDRLWLQHFTGTSWLAEVIGGRIGGFLLGSCPRTTPTRPVAGSSAWIRTCAGRASVGRCTTGSSPMP